MERDPSSLSDFRAIGFFAADHAVVESGKVYASGAYWSTLRFPQFPFVLPACAVVAVISVPFHATGDREHPFRIALEDADGHAQGIQIDGSFRAGTGPRDGEPAIVPIAVPLFGLQFSQPSDYAFALTVAGEEIARYAFHATSAAPTA